MLKRRWVRALVNWLGEWNDEVHEVQRVFPAGDDDAAKTIELLRTFYYSRMATTANVMIGAVAILVALASLIVSAIALIK